MHRHSSWRRFAGLLVAAALAGWVLYATPLGGHLRDQEEVRVWMAHHPVLAPLLLVTLYTAVSLLALPVWWMQVLAGYCFGLVWGLIWCQAGALLACVATWKFSHWIFSDLHERAQAHQLKMDALFRKLGSNGLLIVTATRLLPLVPFGVCNYLYGVFEIRLLDVLIGTVLGGTFAKMIAVAAGADHALLADSRFWTWLAAVNLAILAPLALPYLRRRPRAGGR